MVTLPSEPVPSPRPQAHQARQLAESFGADAERYDRTRPGYPKALTDRIISTIPGPEVLDVGIGTGLAAQPFQAAGCRILGVEPDDQMAEFARHRGFEVEVATFQEWDAAGRRFDAIISGQAWHWVDPVAGAAKAAGLLRPGGRLAAFWNVFQPPPDLAETFAAVYGQVLPDSSLFRVAMSGLQAYSTLFDKAEEGIQASSSFEEPERWQVDWARSYATDEWLEQVPTFGGHRQFPPEKLDELLAGIGAAIDAAGGSFTMGYAAVAVTAAHGLISGSQR